MKPGPPRNAEGKAGDAWGMVSSPVSGPLPNPAGMRILSPLSALQGPTAGSRDGNWGCSTWDDPLMSQEKGRGRGERQDLLNDPSPRWSQALAAKNGLPGALCRHPELIPHAPSGSSHHTLCIHHLGTIPGR
ncbi:hypothetical protein P7K49_009220, partial [Saguinus oedipus]